MKRDSLLRILLDLGMAAVIAFAGAACLTTGFRLEADLWAVALTALVFAALSAVVSRLRYGGWLLLALAGCWLLWQRDALPNCYAAARRIAILYDMGYGWGVPDFLTSYEAVDLTQTARIIASACAMLAAWSLRKRWHTGAALALLLPVLPCIVLADTAPETPWLLLGIGTLALLALTSHTRWADLRQANRLTALLLIPVLLATLLLGQAFPQNDYQPTALARQLLHWSDRLLQHFSPPTDPAPSNGGQLPPVSSSVMNLGNAGPRPASRMPMLQVVSSQTDTLYLRGRSYDVYTGLSWEATPDSSAFQAADPEFLWQTVETLEIIAMREQSIRYFTYYPTTDLKLVDGLLELAPQNNYTFQYRSLRQDWQTLWTQKYGDLKPGDSGYDHLQAYLQLPEETAAAAQDHLRKLDIHSDTTLIQIVARIRDYVQSSADYDLMTDRIPQGETDFALWFLNRSETGYCVHFATAAAMLLRAAGVPARYVEGYIVSAREDRPVQVQGKHAHAWVEYYLPHVGWMVLEATPGFGNPELQPTGPTQPPATTQPTEPTPPTTQPTQPTQPTPPPTTQPTQPTQPPATTRPTQPTQPPATAPGGDGETPGFDWRGLLTALLWILQPLVLAAAIWGQWQLRLRLRRKRMEGREFIHVKRRWRYACYLARLCGHKPPKPLLALLKKAKFSRNGLNKRELRQFKRYHAACIRGLRQCPWYAKVFLRLVLAAW